MKSPTPPIPITLNLWTSTKERWKSLLEALMKCQIPEGEIVIQDRVNILGVGIHPLDMDTTVQTISRWLRSRKQHFVCVTPAHAVMDCYRQPELRKIFNSSGLTTPDGMSVVWLLRLKGYQNVERVYGPDLMKVVSNWSVKPGYRHFYFGGKPGVAEDLADRMREEFPGLQVSGVISPPFGEPTPEEDSRQVDLINESGADIVWVGISSPKQERWMAEHIGVVHAPVLIGVGAAFDFLSGHKKQAPRWIQRSGFEWLYRLASEPRRLWGRYRQYPLFTLLILAQALGLKKIPLET